MQSGEGGQVCLRVIRISLAPWIVQINMHTNFRFAEYHAFLEIHLAITYGIFKTMDSNPVY